MATEADQVAGYGMVSLAFAIFTYYSIWVVILPFVHKDHIIHDYFLPRVYAVMLPVAAGVIVLFGLAVFIAYITLKSRQQKQKTS